MNKPSDHDLNSDIEMANEDGHDNEEMALNKGSKFTDTLITLFLAIW